MARRPVVGADEGVWGTIDNEWCLTEHADNGTHDSAAFLDTLISQLVFTCGGADGIGAKNNPDLIVDKATKTGPIPSGVTLIYVT